MFLDIETAVRNRDGVFGDKKQPSEIGTVFLEIKKKVSEKAAFFFCYAARLLSIFIFKISLVFSIITFREVFLQK